LVHYALTNQLVEGIDMKQQAKQQTTHQWTLFQKGKIKVKACSCCGQMLLPSNLKSTCEEKNISLSPIVKAGYEIAQTVTSYTGNVSPIR
jgi:hypothetical protein